ncbi:alpha/beta hydrolase [Agilicoccus flavus]|uniref:alpha/beta hydrolase n=1 Tax=Agilicoccus flavus TaxID=2775968 RepID=UPI001CF6AFEC|nr:alpha/beta hydrolase [Agilicoccus flavus]
MATRTRTDAQRRRIIDHLSAQRWVDAEKGRVARGPHEIAFDARGEIVTGNRVLPRTLPADADPVTSAFFDYYRTDRGYHPRSINSTTAWTATTPMPFFEFDLMSHLELVAPRPVMLVAGADAHSRYYSEDVKKRAPEVVDLVVVPDADHVDLYDRFDRIPFDRLEAFFGDHPG